MNDKLVWASDGRLALQIRPHSLRKLKIVEYYLSELSTSMRPTDRKSKFKGFEERNYIDLFCGPGRCVVAGQMPSGTEVDGSALMALKVRYPFSAYYFVDIQPKSIEALAHRSVSLGGDAKKRFFTGDCNEKVDEVLKEVSQRYSINVALLDSFTIACKWSTIEALARCTRMDLIINFPQGMSINRNLHYWAENEDSELDNFFGNRKWREIYAQSQGIAKRCIRGFLDLYKQGLSRLGYRVNDVREVLITSRHGQKLYYLLFASRNPLGDKFWGNATRLADESQLSLFS